MNSIRLPNKPIIIAASQWLFMSGNVVAANLGPVLVACDDDSILEAIHKEGGTALLTNSNLPSGSDRIFAALCEFDSDEMMSIYN